MPIPKFAKAMAKRAKAKPKVITSKESQTKQSSQKFAKDDMELAKLRKEKIKKNVEKIMPKYSKDDMELLEISNKIDKMDFKKMKYSDISKNVTFAKDKVTKHVDSMIELVEIFKNPSDITIQTLIDVGKK